MAWASQDELSGTYEQERGHGWLRQSPMNFLTEGTLSRELGTVDRNEPSRHPRQRLPHILAYPDAGLEARGTYYQGSMMTRTGKQELGQLPVMKQSRHMEQNRAESTVNSDACEMGKNADTSGVQDQNKESLQAEDSSHDSEKTFWMTLKAEGKVDLVFDQMQNTLLSLKQKIKDGSATNKDHLKAMLLLKAADLGIPETFPTDNEAHGVQKDKLHLNATHEDPYPDESCIMASNKKGVSISSSKLSSEDNCGSKVYPVRRPFQKHCFCRASCFSERSRFKFKGENTLKIPVLCHFQRRHAKTTCISKSLHVYYQAPCGRSLRNFEEVHQYLFQTKCSSLFVNYFSFNTYVQLNRTPPNREALAQEFDISRGVESVPVSFCNEIDCSKLPYFIYKKSQWPPAYYMDNFSSTFKDSCSCTDGCRDISKCACLQLTAKTSDYVSSRSHSKEPLGYCYRRLPQSVPTGIFECSMSCKCDPLRCQNRVVQLGLQVRLQVFKTEDKGWGVRCLDDIDVGTFICTYAGQILSRNDRKDSGPPDLDVFASVKDNEGTVCTDLAVPSVRAHTETSSSDSEIELVQKVPEDPGGGGLENPALPPQSMDDEKRLAMVQKYGYNVRSMRHPVVKRPKTKTAILQSRRQQLKRAAAVKNCSSEDESPPVKHCLTRKAKLTTKEKSLNSEIQVTDVEQKEENRLLETMIPGTTAKSKENKRPLQQRENEKLDRTVSLDNKNVIKRSVEELHTCKPLVDDTKEQVQGTVIFEGHLKSSPVKASSTGSLHNSLSEQSTYLLDATQEGNVGRFLNHSCCPNLFVQNVFVDTHDRNFPWVAFFTNRLVKAGTELTWDYNYEVGSLPDREIPCLCGFSMCRKRII